MTSSTPPAAIDLIAASIHPAAALAYEVLGRTLTMDEFGNELEVVSYPGRKHYLSAGNEKYANYFDEEIMERTDAFLRHHGFMP